jgi:hypothetical protein
VPDILGVAMVPATTACSYRKRLCRRTEKWKRIQAHDCLLADLDAQVT